MTNFRTATLVSHGNGLYSLPSDVAEDIDSVISVQFGGTEQPGFVLLNRRTIRYKASMPKEMGCGEIKYTVKQYECETCNCL